MNLFRNLSIRSKLLYGYLGISLLGVIVCSWIFFSVVFQIFKANIENELRNSTNSILNMVKTVTNASIRNHLRAVAEKNVEITQNFYDQFQQGLITELEAKESAKKVLLSQKIGETGYIYAVDSSGIIKIHPKEDLYGVDLSKYQFIQEQKLRKEGYIEYDWANPDEKEQRPKALYMSYFEPWDWIISVSSYREEFKELFSVKDFEESILSITIGKTGYPYVINMEGNVVIHPNLKRGDNFYNFKDANGRMFVKEMIEHKNGTINYLWKNPNESEPREKFVLFNYIQELDWIVISSSYLEEFYEPLKRISIIIGGVVFVMLILVFFVIWRISSSITQPLQELMHNLDIGAKGDFTSRMGIKSSDEIGRLAKYYNSFMIKLQEYSEHLEKLVEDRTRELNITLTQLEQQNTTLMASNRKLEDVNQTKERLLKNLTNLQETHLQELHNHLNALQKVSTPDSMEKIRQIIRGVHLIEEIIRPITSLYLSEKAIQSKRVLLAETNKKQQIIAKMALGGTGVELDIVSEIQEGQQYLENKTYDIICANIEMVELTKQAREQNPQIQSVFMTSEHASTYLPVLDQNPFLYNIVSRNEEDRTFTLKNIITTISKLITNDYFGLEKYLNWGTEVQQYPVVNSATRGKMVEEMESYFTKLGVRRPILKKCAMVVEELLMNAIYDAPVDHEGRHVYNHLSRTEEIELNPEEQGIFRYACDGLLVAVSVEDPFGAFNRETILNYLKSCYEGRAGTLQEGKGGAGRGLFQIIETSDLVVFNVKPKVRTEVIAIFNIDPNKPKTAKSTSFHYFLG